MTVEKWVFGVLVVVFGASLLWVFARRAPAGAGPDAAPVPTSAPLEREPAFPEPTRERAAAPSEVRAASHAGRPATIGTSSRRAPRSKIAAGRKASRHHRRGKHAARPRPSPPRSRTRA
jgi:hypothetical protein